MVTSVQLTFALPVKYYKRIENIECISTHRYYAYDALQCLLLPVGDWYKQCGCVGAWAKHSSSEKC